MNRVNQNNLISQIRKYIRIQLDLAVKGYDYFAVRQKGCVFVLLFNLKSKLFGSRTCIQYIGLGKYVAKDAQTSVFFHHEKQAFLMYAGGINARGLHGRASEIAKSYLITKINFLPGDTIVDCGSNIGDLKLYFDLIIKKKINYIAIEPSQLEYECLIQNTLPYKAFNVGLWNKDGIESFYLSSDFGDSSFIPPATPYTQIIKTETKRLDSILDENIKLLKIEAEGAELEVVQGAINILAKIEWIAADLGYERGVDSESTFAPVTNYLLANEFELVEVNHDRCVALYRNTRYIQTHK